jgi:hypothetical protein
VLNVVIVMERVKYMYTIHLLMVMEV